MYLYVELWKTRPAWLALSREQRAAWMDKLLAGLQEHLQSGVEVLGFARGDADTPLPAGYDFLAAWRMPGREAAERFERFVEGAGWHEYFEQVNARGRVMETAEFVSSHLDAGG
ncbi:MAG TPA: DUF6616 family protein [Pyrinomonadaceae bacterium]